MNIFFVCFLVNVAGCGFSYMSDNTLLMSLNLAFALFNGVAYCISFDKEQ